MKSAIVVNEKERRFELIKGVEKAFIDFQSNNSEIAVLHTEVPENLQGRGVASRLADFVFKYAEANGFKVEVYCSFIQNYLKNHPEYLGIVE